MQTAKSSIIALNLVLQVVMKKINIFIIIWLG
jgi:hypothetical protein